MKIADHLKKEQRKKLKQITKKEEKIDWDEIMGTRKDTYKRVRGAVRRR